MSRNKREGLYCGRFRWIAWSGCKKKSWRQPMLIGQFMTLKERKKYPGASSDLNKREGLYCGRFRWIAWSGCKKKSWRQPMLIGQFMTLKERKKYPGAS